MTFRRTIPGKEGSKTTKICGTPRGVSAGGLFAPPFFCVRESAGWDKHRHTKTAPRLGCRFDRFQIKNYPRIYPQTISLSPNLSPKFDKY